MTRWTKTLPYSRPIYPSGIHDRLKYFMWRVITPLHPFVRDALLFFRLVSHGGRQDFLLGTVAPDVTIEELVSFLIVNGYGNHFVAWKDDGQLVSLRYVDDFKHQYHVRVFEDGEVRAHFEYTPECHPILHLKGIGLEDRREPILTILGQKIIVN